MDRNPFSKPTFGTLDETVVRSGEVVPRFGWHILVSCFYVLLSGAYGTVFLTGTEAFMTVLPIKYYLSQPAMLPGAIAFLVSVLLIFRIQIGWVGATIIVSGMIVLSTIGFVVQFIPTIEPVTDGRWVRLTTASVSAGIACFVFYLLSHPRLRAGFRIPQSWIRRCVTLGGLFGTGMGMWLMWLVMR